jgi:RNA polymerase sigma factor (sigma-70 family)
MGVVECCGMARMEPTRATLLSRVRNASDVAAWREFEDRYRELLVRFCVSRGVQHADAEDVVQVVMANVSRAMASFQYDPSRGRFRDYLFRCARNAISQVARRPNVRAAALDDHDGSVPSGEAAAWEREWVAHHYRLALATVRETFDARSVELFEKNVAGMSVASIAREYEMSEQAVHKVRQRIRARMEELVAQQVAEEDAVDA